MISKKFFTHFFKDKKGKIVIVQAPNWPLYAVIFFYLLQYIQYPYMAEISFWGGSIFLFYWAYLEISSGVNNWRKLLGLVVGARVLMGLWR